jgi:hypothetical protein
LASAYCEPAICFLEDVLKILTVIARMIVVVVIRMTSFDHAGFATDPTLVESRFIAWTSVELNFSIVSATIPMLRSFVTNLSTHFGAGQAAGGLGYGQGTSQDKSHASSSRQSRPVMHSLPGIELRSIEHKVPDVPSVPNLSAKAGFPRGPSGNSVRDEDRGSIGSDNSRKMIIRKDFTWRVEREVE